MISWILLNYKLPARPSALRVYVWRQQKRLGAVLLNDAVWVLPDTPRTFEQFQWLATEIQEMQGTANFWRASLVMGIPEDDLVGRFTKETDQEYTELLKKLGSKNADFAKLSQEYQQIIGKDYFRTELGKQVRAKLLELRGEKV
ncbi:MAG: Chromate resistance protein ChrB [Bacteroidota bacterium]